MAQKSPDNANIFRIDSSGSGKKNGETHGWQVRIYRNGKPTSRFFSDNKFPSKDLALGAAQVFRDEKFEELGVAAGEYFNIHDELPINNTSGIIGVNRTEYLMPSTSIYTGWQTTYPNPDEGIETRKFSVSKHGEMLALRMAVEQRLEGISKLIGVDRYTSSQDKIKNLIETYLNILIYFDKISKEEELFILNTILDKTIKNTTKQDVVNGRIGQGEFKDKLAIMWGNKCCITGSQSLLNASHIKPWKVCTDLERLDPFNGFLLSPVYDRAFDQGLISFQNDGKILISPRLANDVLNLSINVSAQIQNIRPFSFDYLNFHRENIFLT